jgi:hypothetical protein
MRIHVLSVAQEAELFAGFRDGKRVVVERKMIIGERSLDEAVADAGMTYPPILCDSSLKTYRYVGAQDGVILYEQCE